MKSKDVPAAVKQSLQNRFPQAIKVSWEKEKTNFEANWGGKSGEDHSAQFTPSGEFLEIVDAIPVADLPKNALTFVHDHFKTAKISEAGRVTDAKGKLTFEAVVHGKDILFDERGNYLGTE